MRTLNTFVAASILTLEACSNPTPTCDRNCENTVNAVGAQLQMCLRIDETCATIIHNNVVHCMVRHGSSGLALPGDDCMNMAAEKMLQCAK